MIGDKEPMASLIYQIEIEYSIWSLKRHVQMHIFTKQK